MIVVINFKNYKTGKEVLDLGQLIKLNVPDAIIGVPFPEIKDVKKTGLKVYAQHVDFFKKGRGTGYLIPEELKSAGGEGSFLNHSEHKLDFSIIGKTIRRCKRLALKNIVFAQSLTEAKKMVSLNPYAIAYEDPILIGSGKSITKYRTNEIEKFVKILRKTKIIPVCGAGISNINDIMTAKKLGCGGVAISSAIANVSTSKAAKFLKQIKTIS